MLFSIYCHNSSRIFLAFILLFYSIWMQNDLIQADVCNILLWSWYKEEQFPKCYQIGPTRLITLIWLQLYKIWLQLPKMAFDESIIGSGLTIEHLVSTSNWNCVQYLGFSMVTGNFCNKPLFEHWSRNKKFSSILVFELIFANAGILKKCAHVCYIAITMSDNDTMSEIHLGVLFSHHKSQDH